MMEGRVGSLRRAVAGVLLIAMAWSAHAQDAPKLLLDRKAPESPALLVLGSGHLANPGRDAVNIPVENVLTEKRQAQIVKVVDELAAFRPTLVAIEWPQAKQADVDAAYADYRAGRLQLNASEHHQFGFRLAAKLNLPRVHAVDWNGMPPGDAQVYNYLEWAQAHGQKATWDALLRRLTEVSVRLGPDETIGAWLARMNRPQALLANHRTYFDIASFGDAESQPGAAWVGTWYARNLRIFTNLTRLTSNPQDRVLAIYGYGHAHLLRQFALESNAFRLVDVDAVLKGQ